jgi:hypothetical protein
MAKSLIFFGDSLWVGRTPAVSPKQEVSYSEPLVEVEVSSEGIL